MKKLLLSFLLLMPVAAHADDVETDGLAIKELLTRAGIIGKGKSDIDYRERPSLVVPKTLGQLPEPQDAKSKRNAQWPVDSDVENKRLEEQQRLAKLKRAGNNRLSRDDMDALAKGQPIATKGPENKPFDNTSSRSLFSRMLDKDLDERIEFKGEGERTSLTQPPKGYQTPSKNQPYGPVGKGYMKPVEEAHKKIQM